MAIEEIKSWDGVLWRNLKAFNGSAWVDMATGTSPVLAVANPQGWNNLSSSKTYDAGSGSNRVLVVAAGLVYTGDNAITGATYGGVAMTPVAAKYNDPYSWAGVRLFYLANPASGSNTLTVTTGDGTVTNAVAILLTGADTSSPVGTVAQANGDSNAASVSVPQSGTGNLIIGGLTNGNDSATQTGTSGSTVQVQSPSAWWFRLALVTKPTTGSGSLTLDTSQTADGWAFQAIEFKVAK